MPTPRPRPLALLLWLAVAPLALAASLFLREPQSLADAPAPDADQILVIGTSANKGTVVSKVSASAYRKTLATAFGSVHDSLLPSLEGNESRERRTNRWHLRSVGVGIGLSGTVGLGPLLSATASAHLRLVFSNHLNPIYPD
jgi:hypothetical protein